LDNGAAFRTDNAEVPPSRLPHTKLSQLVTIFDLSNCTKFWKFLLCLCEAHTSPNFFGSAEWHREQE